jgi:hypothetical protein
MGHNDLDVFHGCHCRDMTIDASSGLSHATAEVIEIGKQVRPPPRDAGWTEQRHLGRRGSRHVVDGTVRRATGPWNRQYTRAVTSGMVRLRAPSIGVDMCQPKTRTKCQTLSNEDFRSVKSMRKHGVCGVDDDPG